MALGDDLDARNAFTVKNLKDPANREDSAHKGYVDEKRYKHEQNTPNKDWVINHNKGLTPVTLVSRDHNGKQVRGSWTATSLNQVIIYFAYSIRGEADIQF